MQRPRRRVVDGIRRRVRSWVPRAPAAPGPLDAQTLRAAHGHRSFDAMAAVLAWMLQLAQREAGPFSLRDCAALEIGTGKFLVQALALYACGCREVVSVDRFRQLHREVVAEAMSRPILARRFLSPFASHDELMERLGRLQQTGYDLERLRELGIDYRAPLDLTAACDLRARFDYVISYTVLEHLPPSDVAAVLDSAAEALKPGGLCLHFVDLEDHRSNLEQPFAFLDRDSAWEPSFAFQRGNRMRFSWWRRLASAQPQMQWGFPYLAARHDLPLPPAIDSEISHDDEEDLRTTAFLMVGRRLE